MDGNGGCCIARYGGAAAGAYDMSKVDRIMLRYRPIAPKPASSGSVSGGSTPEKNDLVVVRSGRGKRRYVRDASNNNNNSNNKRCNRKRKASSPEDKRDGFSSETVVTLPLLPEAPERGSKSPEEESPAMVKQEVKNLPAWLSLENNITDDNSYYYYRQPAVFCVPDRKVVLPQPVRVVGSWVTVERVTDTWVDGEGLGCTDEERSKNLERDTCPGFISDGENRVVWTNAAYRRMVAAKGEEEAEVAVGLVVKEALPVGHLAFTCSVRMQYTSGKERNSLTLPCDVWRMDGGGFAWRLDIKAALCLGR